MTFLLDIINGIHKFLGYLDISPKYLNRGYTILSMIPTLYILRIIYGLWVNHNYVQFLLYGVVFLALAYFTILNIFYYFLDKNSKADVTQLFVKYLPDEAFNIQEEIKQQRTSSHFAGTEEVAVTYSEDYQLRLAGNIRELIQSGQIKTNDLSRLNEGFLIDPDTLFPYYYVKKISEQQYSLQIGENYNELEEIGRIHRSAAEGPLEPIGLFILGGDFVKDGIRYHEPYRLKLLAKETQPKLNDATTEAQVYSRVQRRKHS